MTAAIDVAIGLVLMYLVLSLFCTTLNEFIANLLKLRANTLRDALTELIDNPDLKTLFYNHGLIDGSKVAASGGDAKPLSEPNAVAAGPGAAGHDHHPSYLAGRDVAMALIDSVVYLKNKDPNLIPNVTAVADAVKSLPPSNIRDAMMSCLAVVENDIVKLRAEMTSWFDSAMDRLSGSYKRNLQTISIIVGLILAVAFNADTLDVAKSLWMDPATASAISQSASQFISSNAAKPQCGDDAGAANCDLKEMNSLDQTLRVFPLGWTALPGSGLAWFYKIIGLIATAIALTLGAPFWFDLLTQFVNLRGSGTKPKSTTS
jgi:hypothetical protein